MGTLPLLAALGLGIAIAAIAVIGFLHMTLKGRRFLDLSEEEASGAEAADRTETNEVASLAAGSSEAGGDPFDAEGVSADRTMPIGRIPPPIGSADSVALDGPRLYGLGGEFAGASFRIRGQGLRMGRDPEMCQIVFPADSGEVSRRHCTVGFDEEARIFLLVDHGSSNGTFLNDGRRLEPGVPYRLLPGDRFALSGGKHWFEVRF
jgi:hypothetical protein